MKLLLLFLLTIVPFVWISIKNFLEKSNAKMQVILHFDQMYEYLTRGQYELAHQEFLNLASKALSNSHIRYYIDYLPSTPKNRICLEFINSILNMVAEKDYSSHE